MSENLSAQIVENLLGFDSPTVANAIEHFQVRDQTVGYTTNELICQTPEIPKPLVGYAVTCTVDTTTPGEKRHRRLDELIELIETAPKPSVLVSQHVGHERRRCCWFGDILCASLEKLGCVGIVTDANGRDLKGIRNRTPGFHTFSSGSVVSHGYSIFIDFDVTVSICGMTIQPGDLLHGDESGLVSVPIEIADNVPAQAHAVWKKESEYFDFLDSDTFSIEGLKRRLIPPQ